MARKGKTVSSRNWTPPVERRPRQNRTAIRGRGSAAPENEENVSIGAANEKVREEIRKRSVLDGWGQGTCAHLTYIRLEERTSPLSINE